MDNRQGKQHHICVTCGRQFIKGNSLKTMTDQTAIGMGFRAIERLKGVHHTTIIHWVKSVGTRLPNANDPESSPEVAELDELETLCRLKKTKSGCGEPLTTLEKEF